MSSPIEFDSLLTQADWLAFDTVVRKRVRRGSTPMWWNILLWLVIATVTYALTVYTSISMVSFVVGVWAAIIFLMWEGRRLRLLMAPDPDSHLFGPTRIKIDVSGLHVYKRHLYTSFKWASIRDVAATSAHVFLWVERTVAVIVPIRDLPAGMTAAEFQARLQQLRESDVAAVASEASDSPEVRLTPPTVAN